MYVYKTPGYSRKQRKVHREVVHESPRAPRAVHHPAEDQAAALTQVVLFQKGQQLSITSRFELSFDRTGLGPFGDGFSVSLGPHQQGQGAQDDGLSGSGLSRNNDQTLREINLQRVYQYVIPDA